MENETPQRNPFRKPALIGLISFLIIFMVYCTIMSVLSPARKMKEFSNEYGYKPDDKNKLDEKILTDSAYLKMLKDKSFLQSCIAMAESDSIYITVNLPDSIINLEINGVIVHKTKIRKVHISNIIEKGNEYIISTMLSRPMTISNNYSSIPKEPLMIRMAPKDTSEFKPDIIPDTADYEPVNYILEMDNGIRFHVYQEEKLKPGDRMHQFMFDLRYRLKSTIITLKRIIAFKIPEYHPFIKIRISRADAKIIYRAIPLHGQIALFR